MVDNLREKEKMLVTSIFSFSQNVFNRFLFQGRQKSGLFLGKPYVSLEKNGLQCQTVCLYQNNTSQRTHTKLAGNSDRGNARAILFLIMKHVDDNVIEDWLTDFGLIIATWKP